MIRTTAACLCVGVAAAFLLSSCCDDGMRNRIEDYLDDLEDDVNASISYDDDCTTLENFKLKQHDETSFRAERIEFEAFAYDEGFEELEMKVTAAKYEIGLLGLPDIPYFIMLDPGRSRYDFEMKFRADGDERIFERILMTVEDEFAVQAKAEMIDEGDELLLKRYEIEIRVEKDFRKEAEEQLDWIDDMMRHVEDDLDEKDARKACKKIREFCKDPDSIKLILEPRKPRDIRGRGLTDLDELVEDFGLKIK